MIALKKFQCLETKKIKNSTKQHLGARANKKLLKTQRGKKRTNYRDLWQEEHYMSKLMDAAKAVLRGLVGALNKYMSHKKQERWKTS